MEIETMTLPFKKVRATNDSSSSYATKAPTATKPTGDGVVVMALPDGKAGKSLTGVLLAFFGTGNADTTFSARVLGWKKAGVEDENTALWIPVTLCEVQVTLGTKTGVAGKVIVATEKFADTITVTTGNDGVSCEKMSPADNTIASLSVDAKGCQIVEVIFTTGGSATDCNALVSKY